MSNSSLMKNPTRFITYCGIGIALFVALTMCIQVPVFENYYLCLGYVVMMVYCYLYGPLPGVITGTMGVVIYCLITSGLRGMPGWTLGNLVIGIICGIAFERISKIDSSWVRRMLMVVIIVLATATGILGVKSLTECLLYAQPFALRAAKNCYAFTADAVMMIAAVPVCEVLRKRVWRDN